MTEDELYGLPLDDFVVERGALAKRLRDDGDREAAERVAGLRKPTVAAWAVNQVVRGQRKRLKALLGAGDALRDAQQALLAGRGDAAALRAARDKERDAVDALMAQARELDGVGQATLERVAETLHAAALDEACGEAVAGGRLERELRHAGLGLGD